VQRIGQDISETVLEFDDETRSLSLGAAKVDADVQSRADGILEYLQSVDGTKTEPEIGEAVEGKTSIKRKALRLLREAGKIDCEGTGRRGDPFRYRFSFSCSPDIPGTREQETQNSPNASINTDDILVPNHRQETFLVPKAAQASFEDESEVRL